MLRSSRSFVCFGFISIVLVGVTAATTASAGPARIQAGHRSLNAGAYSSFREDITEISKLRLDEPKNIQRAQQMLLGHDEVELSHGFVAQMAEIAARSDKFDKGLARAAKRSGGTDRLISRLEAQPMAVFEIDGWKAASYDITAAIAQDGALMDSVAYRLNEVAYGRTANEARLAKEARASAEGGVTGTIPAPVRADARSSAVMSQILALGGVMALSRTSTPELTPSAVSVAVNKDNDQCLRWADLNLKQCLAAARDSSERAYCLSQEGIAARAKCWSRIVSPST